MSRDLILPHSIYSRLTDAQRLALSAAASREGHKAGSRRTVNHYGYDNRNFAGPSSANDSDNKRLLACITWETPASLALYVDFTRTDASEQYCEVTCGSENNSRTFKLLPGTVHVLHGQNFLIELVNKKFSAVAPTAIEDIEFWSAQTEAAPSWIEE